MKTTRNWLMAGMALAAVLTLAGGARADLQVDARIQIRPQPTNDLRVAIWPDRGEGADYRAGDDIAMFVEASSDCYLILYNIDTRGRLNILFPYDPWTDNFVRAGEVTRFPRPQEALDWVVDGPPGVEYVQAIASTSPITLPDWPVYMRSVNGRDAVSYDHELNDFWSYDDRLAYIRVVNRKIAHRHWDRCATDLATFQVRPRHWWLRYQPSDPWPNEFYGEIFIGWPVGASIYVDGVFIGQAPIHVPRHHWGEHVITCYIGNRLVRRDAVQLWPKVNYRYHQPAYHGVDVYADGYVKTARPDPPSDRKSDRTERVRKTEAREVRSRSSDVIRNVRTIEETLTRPTRQSASTVAQAPTSREDHGRTTSVSTSSKVVRKAKTGESNGQSRAGRTRNEARVTATVKLAGPHR